MSTMEEPLLQTTSDTSISVHDERLSLQTGFVQRQAAHVKLEKSYFEVMGLCCSSEVPLVEEILKQLNGVHEISVVVPSKTVIVLHDHTISPSRIAEALNQARLEASVRPRGKANDAKLLPGKWNIACGVLLVLSLFKYVYPPMQWFAIGAVLIGLPNIVLRSIASIRNLILNINVIVLIAVGGTLALQDFTDAAIIVFLYSIAQWLESRASQKALSVMSSLTSMTPQRATLAETGEQVNVTSIKVGTIVAVKAGEVIPVDGVVVEGKCEVDEKTLTGESFPATKEIGATVWAGTINLNGYINVKTSTLAENRLVSRMVDLVEEAQSRKARIQTFIDNCAKWYIPVVVLLSAGIALVPVIFHVGDRTQWFRLALIVLVSACPCALIISTPVTIFCALSKAATTGLLFKGGDYLELLAKVKTIAFDKTGTITEGEFVVTQFQSLHETITNEKLLFWVSSIESKSSHPMAAALGDYASVNSVKPLPDMVEDFRNYPGEGIYGKIDGVHIYIGNHRICRRAGLTDSLGIDSSKIEGEVSGFIFMGATLVGRFSLSDDCRSGALEAIMELKKLGIKTTMLTGDNHGAAQRIQNQLNQELDTIHAALLPEDKAKIIMELKKDGPVAMVGDGINDAIALATADIGISMGISGSALATETSHVILMSTDIRKIAQAVQISRRASRKIVENVAISFFTKGVVLALAIAGYPMLLAAVVTDVGTCLLVIFNSMLLLQEKTSSHEIAPPKTSCCDTTCKPKAGCSESSVSRDVQEVKRSSEGCCSKKLCESDESCDRDIEKGKIPTDECCAGTISCTKSKEAELKTNENLCCKDKANCVTSSSKICCKSENCRSSSGCCEVGVSTSVGIVIS